MDTSEQNICRLCQCLVEHTNYDVIDNVAKNILNVIFPNSHINEEERAIMCRMCAIRLLAAFEFKTLCLENEATMESYTETEKVLPLDMNAIYKKERKEQLNYDNRQNICRLCMQLTNIKCTPFRDVECEMTQMYIPEVNLGISKDPVVCEQCLDSLDAHTSFMKSCSVMEKRVKTETVSCIGENPHCSSELQSQQDGVKVECEDRVLDVPEFYELQIKQESIDIKPEEANQQERTQLEDEWCDDAEIPNEMKNEERKSIADDPMEVVHKDDVQGQKCPKVFRCDECAFETRYKCSLKCHKLQHADLSTIKMFQCDICSYRTPYRYRLEKHKLTHSDLLIIETLKCSECPFETIHRSSFKTHKLKHEDQSQVAMLKCDKCPYQTKYKSALTKHGIIHADSSQVKMYMCNKCSYGTIHKNNLERHKLTHFKSPEKKTFTCDKCTYQTIHKWNLNKHKLKHADVTDIEMYQCDKCSFETKYRFTLIRHKLTHDQADPSRFETHDQFKVKRSELSRKKVYACDHCSYQTVYKTTFKRHKLRHVDPSEIKMFRCEKCPFQTKYSCDFNKHKVKHDDPSQVDPSKAKMYTCDKCLYKAFHLRNFNRHKVKHACPSEIRMFRCDECPFQSKYNSTLIKHKLNHDASSTAEMYGCDKCSFRTTGKAALKSHKSVHVASSEVEIKYEKSVGKHEFQHGDCRKSEIHKCDKCSYETTHKTRMKYHMLTHVYPSEKGYESDKCSYDTILEKYLNLHKHGEASTAFRVQLKIDKD